MQDNTRPIVSIFPAREGFGPGAFGAISLSVRDFTAHSAYRNRIMILGAVDAEPYEGFDYEALPLKRHWYERETRAYLRAIMRRLSELNPVLIEVHNRPILAIKLREQTRAPIALHLHNDPQEMRAAKTPAQRRELLNQLDAVYCISHWVRHRFLENLSQDAAAKVHTIHSGFALPQPAEAKQKRIVYVGRMTPNKGGLEFAQALQKLLPQHPDWHGYVIGGRRHSASARLSDYEENVLSTMEAIGPNAHYEGFYPYEQTQAMFRDAAIVVIPSLWDEPFGRTALEAIAHGCAVITSGRGGLKEIIGDAGVIMDEVSAESIAHALHGLVESESERTILQQRAREQAQAFEIQACTDRLDNVRATVLREEQCDAA